MAYRKKGEQITKRIVSGYQKYLATALVITFFVSVSPEVSAEPLPGWAKYNRHISLNFGTINQNYRESDQYGLTRDGVLNRETGWIPNAELIGTWQGEVGTKGAYQFPIWGQIAYNYGQGQTEYRGYVQSGRALYPYVAKTGNTIDDIRLRIGVPFDLQSGTAQLVPQFEIANRRWRRSLVEYGEVFSYRSMGIRLLGQWRVAYDWVIEGSVGLGRQTKAHMQAPRLGFDEDIGKGKVAQFGLGLHYRIRPSWGVGVSWHRGSYSNGASQVTNGQQEPPSHTTQNQIAAILRWHY